MNHTATYSPDDNKLRLYPAGRLDADEYARVKAAGFKWAPKQGFFVAPMWTPGRADLLEEMAGEIGDEDKTLAERAEERAERFEEYHDKRTQDAERARRAVASIADGIPFGQPILIGHHSEKHARRDAERIESGMRKAVKLWETAEYWTGRAHSAIRHAKYKERPDVRARRIKGIEADKRKQEKYIAEAEKWLKLWNKPGLTLEQAQHIANYCRLTVSKTNADGTPHHSAAYSGWSAYDVLQPDGERYQACPAKTVQDCIDAANKEYPAIIAHCRRWVEHYDNRLAYERAMLAESGGTVADRTGPEVGGAVRCLWAPRGGWAYIVKVNRVTVTIRHQWSQGGRVFSHNEPLDKLYEIMTKAQVDEARAAGRIRENPEGFAFWLLDSPADPAETTAQEPEAKPEPQKPEAPKAEAFQAMRETLKAGVQVISAPQLFPTPAGIVAQMMDRAGVEPWHRVLEPSAGTGAILGALVNTGANVCAIEISPRLTECLQKTQAANAYPSEDAGWHIWQGDFLKHAADAPASGSLEAGTKVLGQFDRILMNPPFADGADIKHIRHAMGFLKPGGRLVAICANGPRQAEALKPIAAEWHDLPPGSFKESGTLVNTALLVIERPE